MDGDRYKSCESTRGPKAEKHAGATKGVCVELFICMSISFSSLLPFCLRYPLDVFICWQAVRLLWIQPNSCLGMLGIFPPLASYALSLLLPRNSSMKCSPSPQLRRASNAPNRTTTKLLFQTGRRHARAFHVSVEVLPSTSRSQCFHPVALICTWVRLSSSRSSVSLKAVARFLL